MKFHCWRRRNQRWEWWGEEFKRISPAEAPCIGIQMAFLQLGRPLLAIYFRSYSLNFMSHSLWRSINVRCFFFLFFSFPPTCLTNTFPSLFLFFMLSHHLSKMIDLHKKMIYFLTLFKIAVKVGLSPTTPILTTWT